MGEYKNNKRNGFGIEENPNVGKYEGTWLDDSLTGTRILTFKDGRIYIGQMERANFSGFGKLIWPNGDYYIGNFKEGKRVNGKVFYFNEQGIFDATWEENEGKAVAKGIFYFPNGKKEKRTRIVTVNEAHWEYY